MAPRPPATPAPEVPAITTDHSASAAFGRVDEEGKVFVREGEDEREVGSYPDATPEEALQYFARKYDELFASATLLRQRLDVPDVSAKEIGDGLKSLREHAQEPNVVGDLPALATLITELEEGLATKRQTESAQRAEAKKVASAEREAIVAEAETIAAQPIEKVQWKQSTARMRALLDEWKTHQRGKVRLDKDVESSLWQRFSKARNGFDKARRSHFAHLEVSRGEIKAVKEDLVVQAERLSTSTDWNSTAGAFKRLMDDWRSAGRAGRNDDDKLWERFRTAQDAFFNAKDADAAAEDEAHRGNLEAKETILAEAQALLPIKDLEKTKAALRDIQDRWEAAGKVPRADIARMEKGMQKVEQSVRDLEDKKWSNTNPELSARASSMATQLESKVAELREDVEAAEAKGDTSRAAKLREQLEAQQAWLDQARKGLDEFGG
ncbi:ATPase [Janibacter sp. Soil728]|nr:ATPase [Janibacter sp. Soil728]